MVAPTIVLEFETTEGGHIWNDAFSSDVGVPLSFKYGFNNNKPNAPHVAGTGTMRFSLNNFSSDLKYTEPSSDGSVRGKGINTQYRLSINYDSDNLDPFTFIGRVSEWNVAPGLVGERVTEVVCHDYMNDLSVYVINGLVPMQSVNAATALTEVASAHPFPGDVMPYSPYLYSYSTNGEVFTLVFHDIIDGVSKGIQAFSRVAESELGHVFCEGGTLYYNTNNDWINLGTSIGMLDNRFSQMDVSKNRELEYAPVFVNYYPAVIGDTDVLLADYFADYTLPASSSKTFRLNYRDPSNEAISVTSLSVIVGTTTTANSDMPGSDYAPSFSNKGSAVEVTLTNTSPTYPIYVNTITAEGTPIYIYDRSTVVSSDGNPSAMPLELVMKYNDDIDFAEEVSNYLANKYSVYPSDNTVRSISFVATADSDTMTLAMKGKLGKSVTIIEDVNVINEPYRITSVAWDIYAPELIVVTWGVWPENRYATKSYFLSDSDDSTSYMTDSDSNRFAFWR